MQEKKYAIKQWSIEDRPREKLRSKSPKSLSNSELLAILLKYGTIDKSAIDLARELLEIGGGDLQQLASIPLEVLTRIKGVGLAKASTIQAALELGRRIQGPRPRRIPLSDSSKAAAFFIAQLSHYNYEVFAVLYLNQANYVKGYSVVSEGGITGTLVDTRLILHKALNLDAVKMILCHNHPSGNLQPSSADLELTKKIKSAADLLDMLVIDHLIVSDQRYLSFADEGLL